MDNLCAGPLQLHGTSSVYEGSVVTESREEMETAAAQRTSSGSKSVKSGSASASVNKSAPSNTSAAQRSTNGSQRKDNVPFFPVTHPAAANEQSNDFMQAHEQIHRQQQEQPPVP
eukprot:CAMPEP_0172322620 /NCGR_PEP_ID=MMETSP1058-20130122/46420_1 /TAXON_ID=83371 /ORGANISM="Detonula confervacea, Strain CCMP 353" /LENGTH=114 /DNA_ID=CAMNT_0013038411 /DNA_START=23 /DNA_END=363 /DNA_ORIENTATION=+